MKSVVFDFYKVIYDPDRDIIDNDLLAIIKFLNEQNYPLYIFTNSSYQSLKRRDRQTSFLKYFEGVVHDFRYPKPYPKSFKKLFNQLNCEPSDIVLIDDRDIVIEKAKEYGILAIKYLDTETLKIELGKILNIQI
jgi:FMN phosphatase YigB (HAD superfamily)